MAQERFTLRKIREILRLKEEARLSNWIVARACKISNSNVRYRVEPQLPPDVLGIYVYLPMI